MENKVLSFTSEELASSLDSVFSCCLIRGIKNRYRWNNNTADDYRKIVSLFTKAIKKETGKTAFNQITLQDYDAALKSQCEAYKMQYCDCPPLEEIIWRKLPALWVKAIY